MPASKNYPNPVCVYVSDKTKQKLDDVAMLTGLPRTKVVRRGIKIFYELFKANPEKWRNYLIAEENECPPVIS